MIGPAEAAKRLLPPASLLTFCFYCFILLFNYENDGNLLRKREGYAVAKVFFCSGREKSLCRFFVRLRAVLPYFSRRLFNEKKRRNGA